MLWNFFYWKFFRNRHKWSCLETHRNKRHQDILTTYLAQFSVPWMICLRIMVVRRWCVPSLLASGSKEKQVNCSSEIKPLSSKKPWKESTPTCVWYTTETSFLSRYEGRCCTGWSWFLKLPLAVVEPMLIYTIKSLFCWLFSTSDCTWQA